MSSKWLSFALLTLGLPGCATIIEGSGQDMAVVTTPPGASCTIDRKGVRLGMVAPTPGTLRIDKSKNAIDVTCNKDGYAQALLVQEPRFGGTTFGNLLLGGAGGFIVDAATGANYTYPKEVAITLAPAGSAAAALPGTALPPANATYVPGGPIVLQKPLPGSPGM